MFFSLPSALNAQLRGIQDATGTTDVHGRVRCLVYLLLRSHLGSDLLHGARHVRIHAESETGRQAEGRDSMNWNVFWLVSLASILTVLIQAALSIKVGTFSRNQMYLYDHITWMDDECLPFKNHGGMWSDLFLMSPLLGLVAGHYCEWSMPWKLGSLGGATVVSWFMHKSWVKDT